MGKISALENQPSAMNRETLSKAGMDQRIQTKKRPIKTWLAIVAAVLIASSWLFLANHLAQGRSIRINGDQIVVSTVILDNFEDFIPVRAQVSPLKTVFLDSIEGGRVEQVLLEDGAIVETGDLIAVLSNTQLQLGVIRNEALVTEQLNAMRSIELQLEQNRLTHKNNLVDINYQILRLGRQVDRQRQLVTKGVQSNTTLEDAEDELQYYQNRREVTLESQSTDARLQEQQLKFLQTSGRQLNHSLEFARKNLDNLNIRAAISGKLSGFNAEVGQSIAQGERMGQIDQPKLFKLVANIDEFYLGRVDLEQTAAFERHGKSYQLKVAKVYPQVDNGEFKVDMTFDKTKGLGTPSNIRRGQTIQTKLTLGETMTASIIPNGAFFQDTGGQWIFVVNPDGSEAIKRKIKLGRRNARFIEVLEGLEVGERVVTSPYSSFKEIDRLQLSEQ
jgi:HlyD family secretion protein